MFFFNIDFFRFWLPFCLPSWGPKKWVFFVFFSKMFPRGVQEAPRAAQEASRGLQSRILEGFGFILDRSCEFFRCFLGLGPRGAQEALRGSREAPRGVQERVFEGFGRSFGLFLDGFLRDFLTMFLPSKPSKSCSHLGGSCSRFSSSSSSRTVLLFRVVFLALKTIVTFNSFNSSSRLFWELSSWHSKLKLFYRQCDVFPVTSCLWILFFRVVFLALKEKLYINRCFWHSKLKFLF